MVKSYSSAHPADTPALSLSQPINNACFSRLLDDTRHARFDVRPPRHLTDERIAFRQLYGCMR